MRVTLMQSGAKGPLSFFVKIEITGSERAGARSLVEGVDFTASRSPHRTECPSSLGWKQLPGKTVKSPNKNPSYHLPRSRRQPCQSRSASQFRDSVLRLVSAPKPVAVRLRVECPFGGVRVGVLVRIATSGGSWQFAGFNFLRVVSTLTDSFAGDSFERESSPQNTPRSKKAP